MFLTLRNIATATTALSLTLAVVAPAFADETSNNFRTATALPAFSLLAPSGFTPTQNYFAVSLGGIANIPATNNGSKGGSSVGFGLALPSDFGVSMNIDMDAPEFSKRQELAMSVGKYFSTWDVSMSIGIRNITIWHDDGSQNVPSMYVAASKIFVFEESIAIINGGLGNNDYRVITDTAPSSSRAKAASPFASAAYYFMPQVSIIADYTAGITTLGVGLVPIAAFPLSLSVGVYDIGKAIPGHVDTSWIASLSTSVTF